MLQQLRKRVGDGRSAVYGFMGGFIVGAAMMTSPAIAVVFSAVFALVFLRRI